MSKKEKSGTITDSELKIVRDQQDKINRILAEIGYQESKKHSLLHDLAQSNEYVDATKKELEEKYGSININLTDGSWQRVEKDVEDKKD
jgi:hypothetical protein